MTDLLTIQLLLPELILIGVATAIYLGGAFFPEKHVWTFVALAGLAAAGLALFGQRYDAGGEAISSGPLVIDLFGYLIRWAVLGAGLVFVLMADRGEGRPPPAELTGSLLLIFAGLMLVAVSNELVLMFLGLELVSIPTYVVLYLGRRGAAGQEATIKYFFLSILSSALLLYGFSFLYGVAHSTRLDQLYDSLHELTHGPSPFFAAARIGLVLVFAGLGFRLTAVPFHFYAPDVYQGTSNLNAGLLSTLPKIAGLAALVRIVAISMPGAEYLGWKIALALAMITMTLGNVLALWQDNLRRMLAYSSIAHAGYVLVGIAVGLASKEAVEDAGHIDGLATALFYLAAYIVATAGVFAALTYLGRSGQQVDTVEELAGLNRSHPLVALLLAAFLFSLSGIPPLAGFWGKLNLFMGALDVQQDRPLEVSGLGNWFLALAVVGVLNSAISLGYYLRLVGAMYFRAPTATLGHQGGWGAYAAMLLCAAGVAGLGLFPGPLLDVTSRAGTAVRKVQPQVLLSHKRALQAARQQPVKTAGLSSDSAASEP